MTIDDSMVLIGLSAAGIGIDVERIRWCVVPERGEIVVAIEGSTAAEREAFAAIVREHLPAGIALNVESALPLDITTKITFSGRG